MGGSSFYAYDGTNQSQYPEIIIRGKPRLERKFKFRFADS
jgi:hypothetical protein